MARITLGSVLFAHGPQKLVGWFGGFGFQGTMDYFTNTAGLPWMIGFGARLWSFAMAILTIGIIQKVHWQNNLFMNWFGNQQCEGV